MSIESAQDGQLKRCRGALLGLAVGDALGAPVEFLSRDSFEPVTEMMGGGKFKLPPGAWTDDTALALCLAESLLITPQLDRADLLTRFLRWVELGENSATGRAVGIGQNTLWSLLRFQETGALEAAKVSRRSDGNGALMRLAPLPCVWWRDPQEAVRLARLQSLSTHASQPSADACAYTSALLSALIEGREWAEARQRASQQGASQQGEPFCEPMRELLSCELALKPREQISSGGYVLHTLEAALWAVETTHSFEEALIKAVNLGDDSDTVGAVTGQLAGARYGVEAIPERWLEPLAQRERLLSLSTALFYTLA